MERKSEVLSTNMHNFFCLIWLSVTQHKLNSLDSESKTLGRLMLEHPEYQQLWEKPYSVVEMAPERLMVQGGVSPHLHLAIEATVLNQIEGKEPPEATKSL